MYIELKDGALRAAAHLVVQKGPRKIIFRRDSPAEGLSLLAPCRTVQYPAKTPQANAEEAYKFFQ